MNKCTTVLLVFLLVTSACSVTAPSSNVTLDELLVDPSVFPPGWRLLGRGIPDDLEERRAIEGDALYLEPGSKDIVGAYLAIYRYRSIRASNSAMDKWLGREYNSSSIASATPWETPAELPYTSPVAEKSRFACHISGLTGTRICQFMGQYDEFMIYFRTGLDGKYMTYDDLAHILESVDEKMAHYLN